MSHELFSFNEVLVTSLVSLLIGAAAAAAVLLPILRRGAEGEPARVPVRRALSGGASRGGRHHERPGRFAAGQTRS